MAVEGTTTLKIVGSRTSCVTTSVRKDTFNASAAAEHGNHISSALSLRRLTPSRKARSSAPIGWRKELNRHQEAPQVPRLTLAREQHKFCFPNLSQWTIAFLQ